MPQAESTEALNPKTLRYLYAAILLYLAAHLLFTLVDRYTILSGFMVVGLGLIKIACCLWLFTKLSKDSVRFRWLVLASGSLLAHITAEIYAWRNVFVASPNYVSVPASFFASLACVPILASITFNFNRKDPRTVRWIDLAIGLTLGTLFTVQFLFPGHASSLSPVPSIVSVNRLIDFENTFLLVCSVFQFVSSQSAQDRRFAYSFFFWIGSALPLLAIRNRLAVSHPATAWDVIIDLPTLLFTLLALSPMPAWVRNFHASDRVIYLVRGGSPIFMSLALTLLGIGISSSHFYIGTAGILIGIIGYGLRNAIIHGKLLETEDSLLRAKQELEQQASRDGLTGIPNRRLFDQTLHREWRVAARIGTPFAVLLIDVDCFKGFNDTYGHQKGDECLIAVAKAIQDHLTRSGDFAARYGGEEFAVVLPGASMPAAQIVGERLRAAVEQLAIPNIASPHPYVSISVGAAASDSPDVTDISSLLRASDLALYRAKRAGRNRVEIAQTEPLNAQYQARIE